MTDYLTEQEQIEILKNWLKQYGFVIVAGILFAFVGIYGWRYWQERNEKILNHASAVFEELINVRSQNDSVATLVQAKKLIKHYPQTIYGQMAAFMLARDAVNAKKYQEAQKQLQWVIDNSNVASLRQIARIRLGRLLVSEQKPEEGIKVLKKVEDKNFNGLTHEVIGDAYLAMNKPEMARQHYQQALTELPNAEVMRPLLQMKYDNLAS